ncbi:MAG: hemolysin family protein [Planctomycetota bacterium]
MSYLAFVLSLCLCTGCALFFSVNNIALRIFSRIRLLEEFKLLNKEEHTEKLVQRSERLILTCALYRLIFNMFILLLLLGVFTKFRQGRIFIVDYLVIFVIATTVFSVFSLAIPHAWAKYAGEKMISRTYGLLMFFAWIAWPIVYTFQLYDGFIKRLAGVVEGTLAEQQEEKQEEFLNGLEQQKMEGVVDEEEQEMIENVLELSDTTVSEILTPRTDITAIEVNSDLSAILDIINKAGHSRYPIYEDNIDNITGLIYAKDLLTEIGKDPGQFKLSQKMRQAYFVPETKPLRELLHEFQNQKLHIAIVLDEYGGTAGIITLEDIIEEVVGEITDEYEDTPVENVKKIDLNTIEVDARTYIDDLNDEFDFDLPEEEDYDTVGGFVFSHLGYIPKTGEFFEYAGLKFTITSAEARKIDRIRIQKITEDQDA